MTQSIKKIATNDVKTLNIFINEENNFKRYILCQLWITQQYGNSVIDTISKAITNNKSAVSVGCVYDIMREIKQQLTTENEQLAQSIEQLMNSYKFMCVCDAVFELNMKPKNDEMKLEIEKLKQKIKTNNDYINKISNLSEAKICDILSPINEDSQNK